MLSELTEQQTRYAAFPRTSYPPKNGKEKRGRGIMGWAEEAKEESF